MPPGWAKYRCRPPEPVRTMGATGRTPPQRSATAWAASGCLAESTSRTTRLLTAPVTMAMPESGRCRNQVSTTWSLGRYDWNCLHGRSGAFWPGGAETATSPAAGRRVRLGPGSHPCSRPFLIRDAERPVTGGRPETLSDRVNPGRALLVETTDAAGRRRPGGAAGHGPEGDRNQTPRRAPVWRTAAGRPRRGSRRRRQRQRRGPCRRVVGRQRLLQPWRRRRASQPNGRAGDHPV